jgi:hypothetical protein
MNKTMLDMNFRNEGAHQRRLSSRKLNRAILRLLEGSYRLMIDKRPNTAMSGLSNETSVDMFVVPDISAHKASQAFGHTRDRLSTEEAEHIIDPQRKLNYTFGTAPKAC